MSEPKKYWMTDVEGAKALIVGGATRDFWVTHGWAESTEPAGQEFVWLQHEVTGGRGKFVAQAVPLWESRGWHPSDPPAPVNQALGDGAVIEPPTPQAPASKPAVNANSGDKKE